MIALLLALTAGNFATSDETLRDALEAARWRSAVFWTGRPLPGDWSRPCPVAVRPNDRLASAGGATRFRLDGGQVFDWTMSLEGPRASVLADAVPHEVDHMVRASLIRRPIPRWIDEGSAGLWESPREHRRLRQTAVRAMRQGRTIDLTSTTYPSDAAGLEAVYAIGFVLTERLVAKRGPAAVLAMQADLASADRSRRRVAASVAQATFIEVRRQPPPSDCADAGCLFHGGRSVGRCRCDEARLPVLTIYTAAWCGPCRQLHDDLQANAALRTALQRRVHVHWIDVDQQPAAATVGITSLPTFVLNGQRKQGYRGGADLIDAIDRLLAKSPPVKPPTKQPTKQPTERPIAPPTKPPAKPPTTGQPSASEPPATQDDGRERPNASPSPIRPPSQPAVVVPVAPPEAPIVRPPVASPAESFPVRLGSLLLSAGELAGIASGSGVTAAAAIAVWLYRRRRDAKRRRANSGRDFSDADSPSPNWQSPARPAGPAIGPATNSPGMSSHASMSGRSPPSTTSPSETRIDGASSNGYLGCLCSPDNVCRDDAGDDAGAGFGGRAPFPRKLDEARQLLRLRQSEGRVAVLDALRGMVVDDELSRLAEQPTHRDTVAAVRAAVDSRVSEIAPLTTQPTD